jgi:F-type H+-transporting ATPase subunit b
MISTYAFASEAGHGETDIVQRTVNFLLFAGLVWYLVGEPAKNFFASRSQGIADEFKKAQDRLDESIALKETALAKISAAEKFAEELVVTSKKENKIINDNIMTQCELDLETLGKQNVVSKEYAQRKMIRNVVENVITETLAQSSGDFDKEAMANVILKKVA